MPNPRIIFYGGAREFVKYHGQETILHGAAETGKTYSTLWKLHLCALKYPNASLVIARKTQTSIYSTVLRTYTEKVLGGNPAAWGIQPYGAKKPEWFDYPNGARIWIAGLDKAGKVLSAEHDVAYVNQAEELSLEDWETLTTRTTGRAGHMPYSQTIGDVNPSFPAHWMYHRDSLRMFYSKHEENPILYNQRTSEITEQGKRTMAVLDALTGVRKQRLRFGLAAQAEGAIYTEWDESRHLIYASKAPQKFRRYIAALDWGFRNPGTMGVFGLTGDDDMYLIAQYYRAGMLNDWWLEKAEQVDKELGGIEAFVCDPSEPAYIAKFRTVGLNAIGGYNKVVPGINAVSKRLKDGRLHVVRDSLRERDEALAELRKPTSLQDEIPAYVWANKATETPVKVNDHSVDMLRYACAYVDGLGREPEKVVRRMW